MKRLSILLAALLTACATAKNDTERTTVADLDTKRFMGVWYEIARYDHRFEHGLDHVMAEYRLLPDGRIEVTNSGTDSRTGKYRTAVGKAKPGRKPGQLRVSFFLFFYSDYDIMALGKDYEWALIGSRSDKYLWILSRTPTLPEATLADILQIARERGYDTSRLLFVDQS